MYNGPKPRDIDITYADHSYELITCLVSGEQKRILQDRYLRKFGITKDEYYIKFPGAPVKSLAASESYRKSAISELGSSIRSKNLTKLNLTDSNFQVNRKAGIKEFLDSDESLEYRKSQSGNTKRQHKETNLEDKIREYFKSAFLGSEDQQNRKLRASINNPGSSQEVREKIKNTYLKNSELGLHNKETKFKKKMYRNTGLIYQSSYEFDFLELCNELNVLDRIKNSPCFSDKDYPYNFYAPDYILDDRYVIEIKSWYIENLQEKRCPGLLKIKEELVIKKGYKFLYVKDKNYTSLLRLISF